MNVADLTGYFFIDTNILVYQFDTRSPEKQLKAREIVLYALETKRGVISTQVVQEFLNVALRRFNRPMTHTEASNYLHTILHPMCQHYPRIGFYEDALKVMSQTQYSWYDSLIVTSANALSCQTLLSEDLHHGHKIGTLTIRNPFAN